MFRVNKATHGSASDSGPQVFFCDFKVINDGNIFCILSIILK